jgi:hypothetical protein
MEHCLDAQWKIKELKRIKKKKGDGELIEEPAPRPINWRPLWWEIFKLLGLYFHIYCCHF